MAFRRDYGPTSANGLVDFIDRYGAPHADAVDGGLITLPGPQHEAGSLIVGGWFITLAPGDDRTGLLHTTLDQSTPVAEHHSARANDVERYIANLLVASRKLDVVHFIRQGVTIDYREEGRLHDERLALTLAVVRAQKGTQ
jgi:hypothetical protein